jgi:hypothetical protein
MPLKYVFNILILTFVLISCQNKKEPNSDLTTKTEKLTSNFDLNTEYADFKQQMTELDTIKMSVNHSVCTYYGYERIEITKTSDSIKIRSEFKEETFDENPQWKTIYETKVSKNDTTWGLGKFMRRNNHRLTSDSETHRMIEVSSKNEKLEFFTKGLVDLNEFMADFNWTMEVLYPDRNYYVHYTTDSK